MFIQVNLCSVEALVAGIFRWLHFSEAGITHTLPRLEKAVKWL